MMDDDDEYYEDDEDESSGGSLDLAYELEEQYAGDSRFESVQIQEPGPLEGEDFRLCLGVDGQSYFFVSVLPDELTIRVGLATESVEISEAIEQAILDRGNSMTEYLQERMGSGEELEFEMQHFHDDVYYFCSEITYDSEAQLSAPAMREEVIRYLDGYTEALLDLLKEAS
ncbi:hypothetical protein HY256_00865 [Candidatus Sumerlaeota bacterium]|nr:hypothetical protein [Candidatus Sumerlaeota bacterium]